MRKILLSVAFLVMFLIPQQVQALSCVQPLKIEESYERYDGIVIGKVEKLTPGTPKNQLNLKVSKSYKGVVDEYLVVAEDSTWGALWGPSEIGEEYLFFLAKTVDTWENPLCSPTLKASAAANELKFLADKEVPLIQEQFSDDLPYVLDNISNNWILQGNWLSIVITYVLLLLKWR